jgi:hypothetical protein
MGLTNFFYYEHIMLYFEYPCCYVPWYPIHIIPYFQLKNLTQNNASSELIILNGEVLLLLRDD